MNRFFKVLTLALLVISALFVQDIPTEAASKSTKVSKPFLYVKSGRYPGGFQMTSIYSEVYSSYSTSYWHITQSNDHTTADDRLLEYNYHEAYTKHITDGSTVRTVTLTNSSCITDPGVLNWCKQHKSTASLKKNSSSTQHTSVLTLKSSYQPQIFSLKSTFTY